MAPPPLHKLEQSHTQTAIAQRLADNSDSLGAYVRDAVLGAMDGTITTFVIIAGAVGAGFDFMVVMVLGLCNLLADGFSMAVGNYLGVKSENDRVEKLRALERHHIEVVPEGEREEIRQIYAAKGFEGEILEEIVEHITKDHDRWIDTMLQDEWGVGTQTTNPITSAWVTFVAFVFVGGIPLLPLVFIGSLEDDNSFLISSVMTFVVFVLIGIARGISTDRSLPKSITETCFAGVAAAVISYGIGHYVMSLTGAGS